MSEIDFDRIERRLEKRRQRERQLRRLYISVFVAVAVIILIAVLAVVGVFSPNENENSGGDTQTETQSGSENNSETEESGSEIGTETETETQQGEPYVYLPKPEWTEDLLTPNRYSRPETPVDEITGIVIHYVGNPSTTAKQNRDYFEDLAVTHLTSASSHFIVGLQGEILQCVPLDEVAYASNHRNNDTISIEVCHPDADGKFNDVTYATVVRLTAWLVLEYELEVEDVIRHHDVTGKLCPLYYVEHEDAWEQFKADVQNYIDEEGEIRYR
ncbi:MAG: N-acetylmuramoyl-L-alanine amidase [Agathobacter sp.]|nr:N-acetylmuramoyl-L-alanine amidase [Agathobacter sp.]